MTDLLSNINAQTMASASQAGGKGRVLAAIKAANERSGVDFSYLLNEAIQESNLNPNVKASTSSATGLYQFIDQTWLKTVKASGDDYGLGAMADKITVGTDGVARVANEADKKAILALRTNPEVAANMAAELAKANKEQLQKQVGGDIGSTEMYLAHFLGAGGASSFLAAMKENPNAPAASLLPQAASANKSVFYDKTTGEAKSVSEIYQKFAQKFDGVSDQVVRVASASGTTQSKVARASTSQDALAARTLERHLTNEIVLSSLSGSTTATSSSGLSSINSTMSSPFATMMLAQMDMESFGLDTQEKITDITRREDDRRKSTMDTLASVS